MSIKRAFADLGHGQVHYRHAGTAAEGARPLVVLHGAPGSSRQVERLVEALATARRVVAPDLPGHGDSAPLTAQAPAVGDYAAAVVAFLDAIGERRVDVYGNHAGAAVAAEVAATAPDRIGRLVLDGVGIYPDDERDGLIARYAAPFPPDPDGAYLIRAFQMLRDQYLFFPWYDRTRAGRRDTGLPDPREMHAKLVEVLKAAETYHLAPIAAFRWSAVEALPRVACPTLVLAIPDDPLVAGTRRAAGLLTTGRLAELPGYAQPGFAAARREAILAFLDEGA